MLISKNVNVKATGRLIKKFGCKNHDIVKIDIEQLSKGSKAIVEVTCDYCNLVCFSEYYQYINQIKTINKYTCKSKKCKLSKNKEINLKKHGVENVFQLDKIKNKIKETNLERYGVENIFQLDEIKNKIKETNLERYGVEYSSQSDSIKNKVKETNMKRYGVEYLLSSDLVKNKIRNTNMQRYGVYYPSQCELVKNKIKETNMERYGVENYSQSDDFSHKFKLSLNIKKYNGYSYQSKYELYFLKFCESINIVVSNNIPKIFYYINGKKHRYYSDFFYPEFNLVIEIKSNYWYNIHLEKNLEKKRQTILDGYNYILIMDNNFIEFNELIKYK